MLTKKVSDYHIRAMAPGNSEMPLVELVTSIRGVNAIAKKFVPVIVDGSYKLMAFSHVGKVQE